MDCLFCKIAAGDTPADIIYQDDTVVAFRDVAPQAPTHILVIPRQHIATVNDIKEGSDQIMGYMTRTAVRLALKEGIAESGYRLVLNCNEQGGQTVYHIHMHLIGGRQLDWPPG